VFAVKPAKFFQRGKKSEKGFVAVHPVKAPAFLFVAVSNFNDQCYEVVMDTNLVFAAWRWTSCAVVP